MKKGNTGQGVRSQNSIVVRE